MMAKLKGKLMASLSMQLADWASKVAAGDIPDAVSSDMKLRILDILGVSLAASSLNVGRIIREAVSSMGSGEGGEVLAFGDRTSPMLAALANGTLSHCLDYDDTHNESVSHISSTVVSTAVTMAGATHASGRDFLTACVMGNEISARVGLISPGGFHERGYHATAITGTFAAAAVAARLLGLDARGMANAMGIAGSRAAGILEFFSDGSLVKGTHPGWAAHSGIAAALTAKAGMTGPTTVFEGRFGIINTHLGDRARDFGRLTAGLGTDWECVNTSFKPYPCGHLIHQFLDAAFHLQRQHGLKASDIQRVTCRIADWMIPVVCEPVEAKRRPATDYHAKFSLQFCIAAALTFGRLGVEAFTDENIRNPDILNLADRVDHTVDPDAPDRKHFKGWMIIETRDGRRLEHVVEDNWGSAANPMTADQIRDKFTANATLARPGARAREIIALIGGIESLTDVNDLLRAFRASP